MFKLRKTIIFLAVFATVSAGIFIYKTKAEAGGCYSPFQYIDKTEEVYNRSICEKNFQVYYFPVIADGRKYTITLHNLVGDQKLYASRYKGEVDNTDKLLNWHCKGYHCDSATSYGDTKFVTFAAPEGESDYYSWFAVYGTTAGRYQVGVSNSGVMQLVSADDSSVSNTTYATYGSADVPPSINWKTIPPSSVYNFSNNYWTSIYFDDGDWSNMALPDRGWGCEHCYRAYRGTFYLDTAPNNLKMQFASDDGLQIFINGQSIGSWGARDKDSDGCVNNNDCAVNISVGDIPLTNLVRGKNTISAFVVNGPHGSYFDFKLVQ